MRRENVQVTFSSFIKKIKFKKTYKLTIQNDINNEEWIWEYVCYTKKR